MKNKLLSLTVAVSAYNEGNNISSFLKSLLIQKDTNFHLEKILIISDGSTDNTVSEIKKFKSPIIEIRDYKKREGKSKRLNEIYSSVKTDVLVQFDADVIIASPNTIANLVRPFYQDNRIGLIGGNPQPIKGKTRIEKGVYYSFKVYDKLRVIGRWAYGCDGRILALSKDLARNTQIPNDMIANDAFMYFWAKTKGYKFKHVRNAVVYFRLPSTIRDQIRQNTRFVAAHYRLARIFGSMVKEEYKMPKGFYIQETFKQFSKHPLDAGLLFLVNLICRYKALKGESKLTSIWQIAETTKSLK